MPAAVILIADGSEEIEFVTPYDVLVRAGFDVKSVGVNLKNGNYAVCSRGVKIIPDLQSLSDVSADLHIDVLILPGGGPGAKTLREDPRTLALIQTCHNAGKYITFICAATTVLVRAGRKDKWARTVTSHPSVKDEIVAEGWTYSEERVVVDGKVITSRGPGTAMLFALTIVELLAGKEKREEIETPMILPEKL